LVLNNTCDTILTEQGSKDHQEKEEVGNGGQGDDIRKGRLTVHGQGPWGLWNQSWLLWRKEGWIKAWRDAQILERQTERAGDRRRRYDLGRLRRFL